MGEVIKGPLTWTSGRALSGGQCSVRQVRVGRQVRTETDPYCMRQGTPAPGTAQIPHRSPDPFSLCFPFERHAANREENNARLHSDLKRGQGNVLHTYKRVLNPVCESGILKESVPVVGTKAL